MAVPTPSIKPLLIPGGTHTARYVGAIGVGAGGRARGEATFFLYPDENGNHPDIYVGAVVNVDNGNTRFTIIETQFLGTTGKGDMRCVLEAEGPGTQYNYPIGTIVYIDSSPIDPNLTNGELTVATTGGTAEAVGGVPLIIDLTDFSPRLRSDRHFAEQLVVTVQSLDAGLVDVTPYRLLSSDFHGTPIEYLELSAVSDSDANECIVTVTLPHTHTR